MSFDTISARDSELRNALVSTVTLAKYSRLRIAPKVMVASIATFALVGAVTGGAVATASTQSAAQSAAITSTEVNATLLARQQDATLVGTPVGASAAGNLRLDLGEKPKGANGIALASDCVDGGSVTESISGKYQGGGSCSAGSEIDAVSHAPYLVSFTAQKSSGQLTAWASWITLPVIQPSAAQKAEVASGVVTRADYLAAFNRYAGCLAAAGYPLGAVNQSTTLLNLAIPATAVDSGADNRCYVREWKQVDTLWQLQNWRTSTSVVMMQQCLVDQGITPDLTSEQAVWAQVLASFAAKKCMGISN